MSEAVFRGCRVFSVALPESSGERFKEMLCYTVPHMKETIGRYRDFCGVIPPMVTPLDSDRRLDAAGTEMEVLK